MPPKRRNIDTTNNSKDPNTILRDMLGSDIFSKITPAEERRLKADIKKGIDISKSDILKNIIKRCPDLKVNLDSIVTIPKDNLTESNKQQTRSKSPKRSHKDIDDDIDDAVNKSHLPKRTKYSTDTKQNKINTTNTKLNKPNKQNKVNDDIRIELGSEDTDDDDDLSDEDNDYYEDDGFIVFDDEIDDFDKMELDHELNDLYDDVIDTENLSPDEAKRIESNLVNIRTEYLQNKVNIAMIIKANFNKEDSIWFYKNIKRIVLLHDIDKFKLEDTVEKRYKLLISLQKANMYSTFTKNDERDIMQSIITSKHSDSVKRVLINRMCNVSSDSIEEYQKALNWMDTVLSIPTETKSSNNDINKVIKLLHHNLSTHLYGMDDTIREILQAVCSILTDPDNKGHILTLVGPPGVGKTTIGSMISESIGMGFGQVSCGSINDLATITGHGSTYIGSTPGIFTQYLINNGQLDNVMLLDEMDKIHTTKIIPVLLHVLDKSQNSKFKDAFCPEIDIDLSKNLYIVAVNSVEDLDRALRDRLKIINVNGYSIDDKTQICIKHIIPRLNLKTKIKLSINDDVVRKCVVKMSPEVSGVRDVERFFGDIYEKLLLVQTMGPAYFGLSQSFSVSKLKTIDGKLIKQLSGVCV